ncbi:hypothetical protein [Lysobacter hankyongensis]|uniref:hypothetical protein n=1 Tax=Lysobacter hankyongensis TaxID=1176535 RepID=UPI0031EB59D8
MIERKRSRIGQPGWFHPGGKKMAEHRIHPEQQSRCRSTQFLAASDSVDAGQHRLPGVV